MKNCNWLNAVRRINSPNFDERPENQEINLLVIHAISLPPGEFGGNNVEKLFTNQLVGADHPYFQRIVGLEVSAHLFVCRDGTVTQFVDLQKRAWHAGQSTFENTSCCNDFSIGIELEGCDELPFTDAQYEQLFSLTNILRLCYPAITPDRIVGHCDIAPGRKTDPGPHFDWKKYRHALVP